MNTRRIASGLGIAALGVTLCAATFHAMGDDPDQTRRVLERPRIRDDVTIRLNAPPTQRVDSITILRDGYAGSRVRIERVVPSPKGGIVVEARALLNNGIEDRSFVWNLAVIPEGEEEPILETRYDHQVGLSRRGTIVEPTFREWVPLESGTYKLVVSVVEVPPTGVEELNDPEALRSWSMATDQAPVTVP